MASTEMQGRVCLVTGANNGIGKVTALELARRGAHVIMVSRNRAKGEEAQAEIKRESGNEQVDLLIADMSSLASVRQLAQEVKDRYPQLHVLINNAGAMYNKRQESVDGIESSFATNYVGPFLLTNLLLDLLKASAPARIVNVSSTAHKMGKIDFNDLQSEKSYRPMGVYGSAKLALILFTYQLAHRLEGTGVTVNALHPGVVGTSFFGDGLLGKLGKLVMLSPEKGAQTTIYLATSPDVANVSGKYFDKSKAVPSSKASYDEQAGLRLWQITEQLIEQKSAQAAGA
ncbi:SDR family oxidoreductase [Dictyobacter aurantiacus]|uniref:Short-chain dehydrogenase n=1 Tax=Dictyobacter aurantiacus TaxID=1936993 RepID=A0A401ZJK3_9CHLR|nr:SDR family oxidoreductase [Dictyobacter aurantiacus]GCE07045.1 short-chain dehydrogenase [Dictyobacter aurantiacus]